MKVFYILASICLNAHWVAPVYAVKTRTINLLVEQHSCFESRSFSGETLDGGNLTNFVDFKLPVNEHTSVFFRIYDYQSKIKKAMTKLPENTTRCFDVKKSLQQLVDQSTDINLIEVNNRKITSIDIDEVIVFTSKPGYLAYKSSHLNFEFNSQTPPIIGDDLQKHGALYTGPLYYTGTKLFDSQLAYGFRKINTDFKTYTDAYFIPQLGLYQLKTSEGQELKLQHQPPLAEVITENKNAPLISNLSVTDSIKTTKSNMLNSTTTTTSSSKYHVIVASDNLYRLAIQYQTTIESLVRLNGVTDFSKLQIGQRLLVPQAQLASTESTVSPSIEQPQPKSDTIQTHTVREGETLYRIAKQYGIPVQRLIETNYLRNTNVSISQKLTISH